MRITTLTALLSLAAATACSGAGSRPGDSAAPGDSAQPSATPPAATPPDAAAPAGDSAAPAGPASSAAGAKLQFTVLDQPLRDADVGVAVEGRTVTARANIMTPTPCQNLGGTLETPGDTIRVLVNARPNDAATCAQALGSFGYRVSVSDVPPGRYVLVVQHVTQNRMLNERPVRQTITIQ